MSTNELPAHVQTYIDRVVAAAPPLTSAQRDTLAELLRPVRIAPGDDHGEVAV